MNARVHQEVELLRARYSNLAHGPSHEWVLFQDWVLPVGRFQQARTKLCFRIPVGYPQTGPDNFFVDVGLRLADGSVPPAFNLNSASSSGPAPVAGNWGWFSWHPQTWRPAAKASNGDNLLVFAAGIQMCLRGEEVP